MSGPCVFVSVPSGASAGSVLRTGLVERLLQAHPSVEIVLLSPLVRDEVFAREFARPRVVLEELPAHTPGAIESRLVALMQASYLASGATESVKIRFDESRRKKTIRWIRTKRLLTRVVAPSMARKETRYDLIDRLVSHPHAERLFDKYQPVMLVVSSPGLIFAEIPLLRTAVRRRVRSVAIDASWDNFTNKLIPARRVDRLIVWNDVMKEQAVSIHGYRPDQVRVSGPPQWDLYFRRGVGVDREAFFQRIGADPSRALITVTTTPRSLYAHHDHVVRVLVRALQSDALPRRAQVLVRLHPRDDLSAYAEFSGIDRVIVEKPFRSTVKAGDGLDIDITTENQHHLADTMRHSDVVINVASTIAIEAAIFDTPVVNISFDGEAASEWVHSARRYYRFTHYVNITRHNAVRVAETPEQLVDSVARYLLDPSLDRDGRRRVVEEQCRFTDGRSAERVARFVAEELADVYGWSRSEWDGGPLGAADETTASSRQPARAGTASASRA
jgi:hypothetical protein